MSQTIRRQRAGMNHWTLGVGGPDDCAAPINTMTDVHFSAQVQPT
jgi:hypothetical protein